MFLELIFTMKNFPSPKKNHLPRYYSNSEKYDSDVQAHKHAIYDSMSISDSHLHFCIFSFVNDLRNGLLLLYRFDQNEALNEKQTESYTLLSREGEFIVLFHSVNPDIEDIIDELKQRGQK